MNNAAVTTVALLTRVKRGRRGTCMLCIHVYVFVEHGACGGRVEREEFHT